MCVSLPSRPLVDGDLVHDAARRADDVVLRHLAQPRDARAVELQIQIGIEAAQSVPISTAAELPMPTFIGTALNSRKLKP